MLKHIVFWKLKNDENKQSNMEEMVRLLGSLEGKIEGLVSLEIGYNFDFSSDYDVVLNAALKSPAALKSYQNHPEHLKCKEFIKGITVSRVSADYFPEEIDSASAQQPTVSPKAESVPVQPAISQPVVAPSVPVVEQAPKAEEQPVFKPFQQAPPIASPSTVKEEEQIPPPLSPLAPPVHQTTEIKQEAPAAKPMQPVTPTVVQHQPGAMPFSSAPVVPVAPVELVKPVAPVAPVEPVKPVAPVAPVEPVKPVAPVAPTEPVKPAAPVASVAPAEPPKEPATEKKSRFSFGKNKQVEEEKPQEEDMTNKWRCPNCGKINLNYVGTCGCGETKPFEDDFGGDDAEEQVEPETNAWKCPNCGLLHSNFILDCECGYHIEPDGHEYNPSFMNVDTQKASGSAKASELNGFGVAKTDDPKPADIEFNSVSPDAIKGIETRAPRTDILSPASSAPEVKSETAPAAADVKEKEKEKKKKGGFFSKKDKKPEKDTAAEEAEMLKNFWKCPGCGKMNHNYVGTCGCGETKPFDDFDIPSGGDENTVPKSNAWKCPNCGMLNNNFVTVCNCGYDITETNEE